MSRSVFVSQSIEEEGEHIRSISVDPRVAIAERLEALPHEAVNRVPVPHNMRQVDILVTLWQFLSICINKLIKIRPKV